MAGKKVRFNSFEKLFLFASFIMAPAVMLYFALGYFENQKNSRLLETATHEIMQPLNQLKKYKSSESFWCVSLNREFSDSRNPRELAKRIDRLAQITGEPLKYIIWQKDRTVGISNYLSRPEFKKWNNLIRDARIASGHSAAQHGVESTKDAALIRVRELLGPHYLAGQLNDARNPRDPRFIKPDSAGHHPMIWLNYRTSFALLVLFQPDCLRRDHRLKLFFNQWQETEHALLKINSEKLAEISGDYATEIKNAYYNLTDNNREISQFGNLLIGIARANQTDFVANVRIIEGFSQQRGRNTALIVLLTGFFMLMILRANPKLLQPANASIRLQLLMMLFICSGLPLLSLALGALEHLDQQRKHLIRSAYQTCIEYIQEIDRRSHSELSLVTQKTYKAMAEFKRLFNERNSEQEISEKTYAQMHASKNGFQAVASSSNYLIAQHSYYKDGTFYSFANNGLRKIKTPTELKVANDIGSYYTNFLNRAYIDPNHFTEVELLTEMFYQKSLTDIVHDLVLLNNEIAAMGWGATSFPMFSSALALNDPKNYDFFFMGIYSPGQINHSFIMRQADNLRRNEFGLNVFFSDDHTVYPGDIRVGKSGELGEIFATVSTHPALEPQMCTYEGETWIYTAFTGKLLNNFKILAMYPMARIDAAIDKERRLILNSGLAALIILISLTLLFGHSFTHPLSQLQRAAVAVEKRDFAFRLPATSLDEFGEMGRIFNQSIAELEELSIASIVQSRLMPARTIEAGRFDVFGRSVPMADLGGDYYDYYSIDDQRFAVLLGDVAGHGVGASLIMAMAKTAIICCEPWHDQPLTVLENLHRLICATRSKKQRKIMTFQYLCFDKVSGVGKYANAGGCSPILVCPGAASSSEVTLAGPVLGGFKNAKFSEIELKMQPGQALVLYTDGIIETKNPAGAEIGYELFKEWLLKHYSSDASAYYHAVYHEYLQWLAGGDAQDDLTLIMLVYRGENPPDNT